MMFELLITSAFFRRAIREIFWKLMQWYVRIYFGFSNKQNIVLKNKITNAFFLSSMIVCLFVYTSDFIYSGAHIFSFLSLSLCVCMLLFFWVTWIHLVLIVVWSIGLMVKCLSRYFVRKMLWNIEFYHVHWRFNSTNKIWNLKSVLLLLFRQTKTMARI